MNLTNLAVLNLTACLDQDQDNSIRCIELLELLNQFQINLAFTADWDERNVLWEKNNVKRRNFKTAREKYESKIEICSNLVFTKKKMVIK